MDKATYAMRVKALEGELFYNNRLAESSYMREYFPPTEGEQNYARRPKIAFPITGSVVDRLSALCYSGLEVTLASDSLQAVWEEIAERNNFREQARNMLVVPLSRACQVTVLHALPNGVKWQNWPGEFAWYLNNNFYTAAGYEMVVDEQGNAKAVITSPPNNKKPKGYRALVVDENVFIETEGEEAAVTPHRLPFAPFVFARGVDLDADGRYASPFHLRFRDLNIEYNLTMSQVAKAIRILQNVWVTTKELDNPNFPLRLDPDTINHVGKDGKLEQAVRELNIQPELDYASRLKKQISERAQVPDFMTGLDDVGKVESGVAMSIVSGPLIELTDRIRPVFKANITDLVQKSVAMELMLRGQGAQEVEVEVRVQESVLPADVKTEVETLLNAKREGLIADRFMESLENKVAALLGLTEAENGTHKRLGRVEEPRPNRDETTGR